MSLFSASDRSSDGLAQRFSVAGATDVGGQGCILRTHRKHGFDRCQHGGAGFGMAQVLEHHRTAPDLPDRVGDALSGDVGRRTMHRLEQAREIAFRVDVGRGRNADGAGAGRTQVGKDVAEQVAGHHHVEPVRVQDKVRRKNIDVVLVDVDVRIFLAHFHDALIPVGHGDRDAVGFGGRGQVLLRTALRQVVGELEDTVDADAGHHGFLQHDFAIGPGEHFAADAGVLAFGILAHHPEIDVAGLAVRQWRLHAGHQTAGTQIDVLVEFTTELQQRR